MEQLPSVLDPVDEEPRVVEAELVGVRPETSWWRRLLARAAFSLGLGALGLGCAAVGALMTVTVIAAPVGIPLLLIGAVLVLVALFTAFGGGRVQVSPYPPFPPR